MSEHPVKGRRVKCAACGQVLQSQHVHNFVVCGCWEDSGGDEGFFVDGGGDYFRFGGNGVDNMRFEDESGEFTLGPSL